MKTIAILSLVLLLGCNRRYPSRIDDETAAEIMALAEKASKLSNEEVSGLPMSIAGPADYRLVGKEYQNSVSGAENAHSVQLFRRNNSAIGIWVGNSAREGYVALFPERRISETGLDLSEIKETNHKGIYVLSAGAD
jgi:hypothetical protein